MKKYILGLFMAFVALMAVSAAPGDAAQAVAATDPATAASATTPATGPSTPANAVTTPATGTTAPANSTATTTTPAATPATAAPKKSDGGGWIGLGIWAAVILAVFAFLWTKGYLVKIRNYTAETQEELKKCSWPSREELKGSTVVVLITTALLGLFTVGVDWILSNLMRLIT